MIKTGFKMEQYILKNINVKMLSLLRFGVLKLNMETGRYIKQRREDRICKCCTMQCIENEYHFIMVCPAYRQYRLKYFSKHYHTWPNINKLYSLLQVQTKTVIYNLMCFLRESWKLRTFRLA